MGSSLLLVLGMCSKLVIHVDGNNPYSGPGADPAH